MENAVQATGTYGPSPKADRRVRAVVTHPDRPGMFLCQVRGGITARRLTMLLPGGGIESGETPFGTLKREFMEELGISQDFTPSNTRPIFTRTLRFPDGNTSGLVFVHVPVLEGVPSNMEPRKTAGVEWLTREQFLVRLRHRGDFYAAQAFMTEAVDAVLMSPRSVVMMDGKVAEEVPCEPAPAKLPFNKDYVTEQTEARAKALAELTSQRDALVARLRGTDGISAASVDEVDGESRDPMLMEEADLASQILALDAKISKAS